MSSNHNKRCSPPPQPGLVSERYLISTPCANHRYTKSGSLKIEFQKKKSKTPTKHDEYRKEMEWLQYASEGELLPSRQRLKSPEPPDPGRRPSTSVTVQGGGQGGAWSSHGDLFDAVDMASEELRSAPQRPHTAGAALGGGGLGGGEEEYGDDFEEGGEQEGEDEGYDEDEDFE